MKDSDAHQKEPLLNGLDQLPDGVFELPRASETLRRTLRDRTSAVVCRQARWRRLARAGSLVTAYAAGILTTLLLWNAGGKVDELSVADREQMPREELAVDNGTPELDPNESTVPHPFDGPSLEDSDPFPDEVPPNDVDPQQLRASVADASPRERIELLQRAGDLYLNRLADVQSALDCYQQVLELLPVDERAKPKRNDSWLLAELKLAYSVDTQ